MLLGPCFSRKLEVTTHEVSNAYANVAHTAVLSPLSANVFIWVGNCTIYLLRTHERWLIRTVDTCALVYDERQFIAVCYIVIADGNTQRIIGCRIRKWVCIADGCWLKKAVCPSSCHNWLRIVIYKPGVILQSKRNGCKYRILWNNLRCNEVSHVGLMLIMTKLIDFKGLFKDCWHLKTSLAIFSCTEQWSSGPSRSLGFKFKSQPGQKFGLILLLQLRPLANSAMMSACTLTAHFQWDNETVRERISHPLLTCLLLSM